MHRQKAQTAPAWPPPDTYEFDFESPPERSRANARCGPHPKNRQETARQRSCGMRLEDKLHL
jgi:hypothetical protein